MTARSEDGGRFTKSLKFFGLEFAPFYIPIERRLQTLAVFMWMSFFLFLGSLTTFVLVGINFTKILWTPFAHIDPKTVKRYWWLNWIVMLLGSSCIKAAHRTLMKLTPGLNFTNILCTAFTHIDPKTVKRYWWLNWIVLLSGSACVKAARRMLMKLTLGLNFTNILCSAFTHIDPKSVKWLMTWLSICVLLGFMCVKDA